MKMEEWKECKLKDICDYGKDRIEVSSLDNSNYISTENMLPNRAGVTTATTLPTGEYTPSFEIDDTLVSNIRPYFKKIWKASFSGGCSADVLVFKAKENISKDYLYYVLADDEFFKYSMATSKGTKMPRGDKVSIMNYPVKLPPLPTQQKISAILSSLDDKIELNNKINTNLEQQAQALFKNWFVDKYEKEGTIGDYCSVKSGFAFKSAWWLDEGTKVIRIGDIEQGCLNLETCAHVATDKIEVAKDFIVHGGDLVIAMTGATIGKFSMIPKTQEPILVNQRVGKFFLGDNPIEKVPFIYCTLKQEEVITEFINRGQGSAQPNISTGDILSIPCWIPNKNEIDNFNKTIQPMFETIISNQEENRKLSVLRDSLLPKLMSGEIEVGI